MPRLTAQQRDRVRVLWDEIDDGAISTEQCFARVCERASRELGREIDDGDVADALAESPKAVRS